MQGRNLMYLALSVLYHYVSAFWKCTWQPGQARHVFRLIFPCFGKGSIMVCTGLAAHGEACSKAGGESDWIGYMVGLEEATGSGVTTVAVMLYLLASLRSHSSLPPMSAAYRTADPQVLWMPLPFRYFRSGSVMLPSSTLWPPWGYRFPKNKLGKMNFSVWKLGKIQGN